MTTWTPKTKDAETWTVSQTLGLGVFSRRIFSHASHNGLHVFSFGNAGFEGWYNRPKQAETWTTE